MYTVYSKSMKECTKMNSTIALFSSSRRHGNTGKLLDCVARNIKVDIVNLSEFNISEYDYEHNNINDDFLPLIHKVLEYEKIIFASPVYWYSVTPTMKTFIDRISDLLDIPELLESGRRLRGKKSFVLSTSISDEISTTFINAFNETFEYLGMDYCGHLHVNCANGYKEENYDSNLFQFIDLF